jgi:hypothetical protein
MNIRGEKTLEILRGLFPSYAIAELRTPGLVPPSEGEKRSEASSSPPMSNNNAPRIGTLHFPGNRERKTARLLLVFFGRYSSMQNGEKQGRRWNGNCSRR